MQQSHYEKLRNIFDSLKKSDQPLALLEGSMDLIRQVSAFYLESDFENRMKVREAFGPDHYLQLVALSDFILHKALNQRENILICYSIVFHLIEDCRFDERENIRRLPMIWYTSKILGDDPKVLFEKMKDLAFDKGKKLLSDFIKRPEGLKSIAVMGILLKEENGILKFVPKPPPWEKT